MRIQVIIVYSWNWLVIRTVNDALHSDIVVFVLEITARGGVYYQLLWRHHLLQTNFETLIDYPVFTWNMKTYTPDFN